MVLIAIVLGSIVYSVWLELKNRTQGRAL
jgi:hypothetical protein